MTIRKSVLAAVVVGVASVAGLGAQLLYAQQPGFKRVDLQKQDLSIPGREVVQVRGEFAPGSGVGRHTHPGDEITYVLEGSIVLEVDGRPPVTLKAGEVFFVPAGVVHAGRNTSGAPAAVIASYVVEKGKPLATPVN